MTTIFKNARVFTRNGLEKLNILLDGHILKFDNNPQNNDAQEIIDLDGLFLFPGFADVHVHFREPGFSYKETIKTGSYAAAHGGYTAVCTMPNLKPVPSNLQGLQKQIDIIKRDAIINIYPVGAITMNQSGRGELSNIEEIAPYVIAFSDDGKGVQNENLMLKAMKKIKQAGKFITAHCEVESELLPGGCIHDGEYAKIHGHKGINSASEYLEVERDIKLAEKIGARFHVCHVSTKESVEIIRKAKKRGVNVTAETAPHYLIFTDMDLKDDGKWKMNPPIRSYEDRSALLSGIKDGTIDCIITDHAPHSQEEKSRGLNNSAFGIVGLESCFAAMYKNLVMHDPENPASKNGAITLEKLLELMCVNPRKIFNIPGPKYIEDNCEADFVIMDLNRAYKVDPEKFFSMGKSTLFDGMEVQGEIVSTYVSGVKIYDREKGIIKNA